MNPPRTTSGVPTATRPHEARYEADDVRAARHRLLANGATDDQAADILDWLALCQGARRLGAFLNGCPDFHLRGWIEDAEQILGELRQHNAARRPSPYRGPRLSA